MGAWSPWEDANYCWVVICKNKKFHRQTNVMFGHKIPLGQTGALSPLPALSASFPARCDECGDEYNIPGFLLKLASHILHRKLEIRCRCHGELLTGTNLGREDDRRNRNQRELSGVHVRPPGGC